MSQRTSKNEEESRRRRRMRVDDDEVEIKPVAKKEAEETPKKPDVKTETKAKPEPRAKTELKTKPEPKAKTDPKGEAKADPKGEAKADPKGEAKADPKSESNADSKAEEKAKTEPKKKPTEEELKKKFLDDLSRLVKKSQQNSTFLKMWNPKNPLTTGGMAKRLKDNKDKTGVDELIYSMDLAITGTRGDFDIFFEEKAAQNLLTELDITVEEVKENYITYENYENRKDSKELQELRDVVTKQHSELQNRLNLVKEHFKKPTSEGKTRQQKLIDSFPVMEKGNRVYDVSAWNEVENKGYKSMPHPSEKSKKMCMATYPICSSSRDRMEQFLTFLGLDAGLAAEAFK